MAKNLSEIKMRDFQDYQRVCQNLADRKNDPEQGEIIKDRRQEYRLSHNDVRFIRSLRRAKSSSNTRSNRPQRVSWQYRLWIFGNVALFIGIFIALLFLLGRLTALNQDLFRALGGSLLLAAAFLLWLRPVIGRADEYRGMWRALWAAVWRNPFDNPGMLATIGAGIVYAIDWWQPFGSTLISDIKVLIKGIIHLFTG